MSDYNKVLAYCSEQDLSDLAARVLAEYSAAQVRLLSGPRQGLVMLRQQESVADSQFNAGEILVTEVRLELDGQFGFGMVIGDQPRSALALALIDAALTRGGPLADALQPAIEQLNDKLTQSRQGAYQKVAGTRVNFETF